MNLFDTIKQEDFRNGYVASVSALKEEDKAYLFSQRFLEDVSRLQNGEYYLEPPEQMLVPKTDGRLRKVYKYSSDVNAMLTIINYALHKYDGRFASSCYSHVKDRGIKGLFQKIMCSHEAAELPVHSSDLSGFDASVDRELLKSELDAFITDDAELNRFLHQLVNDARYYADGKLCCDGAAIKSGNPLTAFLQDVFLLSFDIEMEKRAVLYCRSCDNYTFYAKDTQHLESMISFSQEYLANKKLKVNCKKTVSAAAGQAFYAMGAKICANTVIRMGLIGKYKQFIAQKRTLAFRLKRRYGLSGRESMELFLKSLGCSKKENVRWILKNLICAAEVKDLDEYIQKSLRLLGSGKRTNAMYRITYEDMKQVGYSSLLHEYYKMVEEDEILDT